MNYSAFEIWMIIILLGLGTMMIRFSFWGLLGNRDLPDWVLRHLRYTAVAVLPGLIAPALVWPAATGGQVDPIRLAAGAVALSVGYYRKSVIWGVLAGACTLWALRALI